jgi:tetratricopeptide (TPR) repeat protein
MMRTYRNEKNGFELHIPEKWSCPEYRQGEKSVVFDCGIRETFNIQISPLEKEESLDEVEQKFREYTKKQGFINLQIGRITVQNKEHLMARYYMLRGIWYKKYLIVFNLIEYQLTAACYDQLTFQESENKWDSIARSFHLLQPLQDKYDNARQLDSDQKFYLIKPGSPPIEGNPGPLNALWHQCLGVECANRKDGDRRKNFEEAFAHLQEAERGLTKESHPIEWAGVQVDIGETYRKYSHICDLDKNLAHAKFHYQQALEVVTRENAPEIWAAAHNNLGIVYASGENRKHEDNIEKAIYHCEQALIVYDRKKYPDDWAMVHNNLGSAYRYRIRGSRAKNQDQAILHFQEALKVQKNQTDREQWAFTHYNLGYTYMEHEGGERAENIEQSIDYFCEALQVLTGKAYPHDWAVIHLQLAILYNSRIKGEPAKNTEEAIRQTDLALECLTLDVNPQLWAMANYQLGLAYASRKSGDFSENLEKTIAYFTTTLKVFKPEDDSELWASVHLYLAFSYHHRISGDLFDNYSLAVDHLQKAAQVFNQEQYPEEAAKIKEELNIINHKLSGPMQLTFPNFYNETLRRHPGTKRKVKLAYSTVMESPYVNYLLLLYEWEQGLPPAEAKKLAQRAIAYMSCVIYDLTVCANLACQPSPFPNGQRPSWNIQGTDYAVSVVLTDIDETDRTCRMSIGSFLHVRHTPPLDKVILEKLEAVITRKISSVSV